MNSTRVKKMKSEKTPMNEAEKEDNRRRRKILGRLSRAPGTCPLGNCDQVLFPSGLLVHLLHKHTPNPDTSVVVVYDEQPLRTTFDPDSFPYDEPQAMTLLLYAGTQGKPHTRPARRYLSFSNCGLLNDRRRFEHYLPLVLMICKTSLFSMLPDRKSADKLEGKFGGPENIVYVIWLVAPVTSSRMIYTLTIFDRYYIQSRSVIRKARNYVLPQHPKDFLSNDTDYLMLRHEEAMDLMSAEEDEENKTPYIELELLLHEEPLRISSCTPSTTHLLRTYKEMRIKMPRNKLQLHRDSRGRLTLNRKPLSNPMISSAVVKSSLAHLPESGAFLPFQRLTDRQWEQRTRHSARAKVTTAEESSGSLDYPEHSVDSDVKVAPNGDPYQEKLDKAKRTEVERSDVLAPKCSPRKLQRCKKKPQGRYRDQLKDELVKYVIAAERRKDKAQQLLKSMESYLEACQESDEEGDSSELKHFLNEFAVERSLGGKDFSLQSIDKRKRYVDCKKRRLKKSKSQTQKEPLESREKAGGSSQEAARKCLEKIQESSIRNPEESILNLREPITNEVLQTVKEAVANSVKDAVRKAAEETIITKLDVASELELEKNEPEVATEPKAEPTEPETQTKSVPEMEPQDEAKPETEAQIETEGPPKNYTKIPGVTINIETEFTSDWHLYSECN
ncbi:uncharacterized protein LOC122624200 [Drosophila teissieri]|uniref:uncharacterized protein LOC122624200 n=1 Tax=Drosophila teissieri TaxID=7243 RepID=UPI001CBA1A04|nr:uncharacterized protein LOC122624200 [Drosophila teissieri]